MKKITELKRLKEVVDGIIEIADDDERAHVEEDDLHRELLREYLPNELLTELERLNDADFNRWCA